MWVLCSLLLSVNFDRLYAISELLELAEDLGSFLLELALEDHQCLLAVQLLFEEHSWLITIQVINL